MLSNATEAAIHHKLLSWYAQAARVLPWRLNQDPYRVWLSEVMLQQTRVETVIPYYERFLGQFPRVHDLAAATEDSVTALWAGLGYYSRARNLRLAAIAICEQHDGVFPQTLAELKALPGIGDYTARAIASICFGQPLGAVDGNLERVLARILGLNEIAKNNAKILALADRLAGLGEAGKLNQAFMDFANRICLAKAPRCEECCLRPDCRAWAGDLTASIPVKPLKQAKVELQATAMVIMRGLGSGRELMIVRRPKAQWLSGMWDLPWQLEAAESPSALRKLGQKNSTLEIQKVGKPVLRTITKHRILTNGLLVSLPEVKTKEQNFLKEITEIFAEYRWLPLTEAFALLPKPSQRMVKNSTPESRLIGS